MIDNSWGLALQTGVDFEVAKDWKLGVDVRWANIQPKARVNLGTSVLDVGKVKIDPIIYGVSIGRRFNIGG
jgi:outer membrane protein